MSSTPTSTRGDSDRTGFSLIELLVVIVIIAIVIGITVPAIGGARDLANASSTQSTLSSVANAISSFQADEQRLPGYFNAQQMGEATTGFSSMQNIMLDLAGGPTADPTNAITVGPDGTAEVDVNLGLIGAEGNANGGYYSPDGGWIVVENKTATDDNALLPELTDAWGMPILAWAEDEFAPTVPEDDAEIADFAALTSAIDPARFYWQQNATLVSSDALGPRDTSQAESLLNLTNPNVDATGLLDHLAALLGSPADPVNPNGELEGATVGDLLPGSAKGGVVLHSAGRDRVYLSEEDPAFRELGGQFTYGKHFSPTLNTTFGDTPWSDADGTTGNKDIAGEFNDVITNVGG